MKLLLDEMWTPTIAVELRKRGVDCVAISEPACASRYAGVSDDQVFARAQEDDRTIVTDNIADFEAARLDAESRSRIHHGVLYALDPPFNRHHGDAVIGQMVRALEAFVVSAAGSGRPVGGADFLRPA